MPRIHPHAVAAFGIGCAEDNPPDPGPKRRAGAHWARLEGHIQRALIEVLAAKKFRRRRKGLHFGMGREVIQPFAEVVGTRNHLPTGHDDGTNGHFVLLKSMLGLGQSEAHEVFIVQRLFHRSKLRGSDQFVERLLRTGVGVDEGSSTGRRGQLARFELLLGAGGHAERLSPMLG